MSDTSTTFCKKCSYDLRATPAGPCPECARPFDPSNPRTFRRNPRRARRVWTVRIAIVIALLAGLVSIFPRGYIRISSTLLDASMAPIATTSTTALLMPRWLKIDPKHFLFSDVDTSAAAPPAASMLTIAVVAERHDFWPWETSVIRGQTSYRRSVQTETVTSGSESAGVIALRSSYPTALTIARGTTPRNALPASYYFENTDDATGFKPP